MQHNATHLGDLAVTTQVKQLRGFVSAPAGTDLSQLLEALEENNIHILDPARFAPGAVKITDKIIDGISNADLVIAVLGTATSSGNVLFELGCASALDKKTLVIIPEGYEIPSDIKDLVYIRTTPNNREAITFALEQIINAPEHETNPKARLLDKRRLHTDRQAKYVVEQVLHYISLSNVRAVIVFAAQISSEAMKVACSYPNLYFFDLHDFLKRLRQESLGQLIRNERNARVHGRVR